MKYIVLILHFLIAAVVTIIAACILQTQMVLHELSQLDVNITVADRFYMSWQDLWGLTPSYGVIITVGLAIGFGISKLVKRYTPVKSSVLYIFAGGAVMAAILLAMQPVLGVTLVAGARSMFGIFLQILAGIIGGFCFMYLRKTQYSAN